MTFPPARAILYGERRNIMRSALLISLLLCLPATARAAEKKKCPHCDGLIRPKVVLFGEALPEDALQLYNKATVDRDLVVLIGTTGVFPYIAQPAIVAKAQGIPTVEINPTQTRLTPIVDHHIAESAATALDSLWDLMQQS